MAFDPQTVQHGVCIIGAGHAGGRSAHQLRALGYDGPIALIGDEPYAPYERPPLSKGVLLTPGAEDQTYLSDFSWYAKNDVTLRTNIQVLEMDRHTQTLTLSDGDVLNYDQVILATGGRLRALGVPGAGLNGVCSLKSMSDAKALRTRLFKGVQLVVIGGGFIGLEVAASARALAADVTVVEATDRLMGRALPPVVGSLLRTFHESWGTKFEIGQGVTSIEGEGPGVSAVILEDGRRIPADLVVVGIGILPDTRLAVLAGLTINNGIVVDAQCRTSDPRIFAIGDVASRDGLRLESWQNAEFQAACAAAAICGHDAPPQGPPWFWSDQQDINLQILGRPTDWNELLLRGDPSNGPALLFKMRNARVEGVIGINSKRDMLLMRKLMAHGGSIESAVLTDTGTPLKKSVLAAISR